MGAPTRRLHGTGEAPARAARFRGRRRARRARARVRSPRARRAPARHRQPRATYPGTSTRACSATPSAFCGPRRPAKTSALPESPSSVAQLVARRHRRDLRGRIREHRETLRIDAPAERHVAQVRARAEDVPRTAQGGSRASRAETASAGRRPFAGTRRASRRSARSRVARSNTSSDTSFTTSGRRASCEPIAARRIMLVA